MGDLKICNPNDPTIQALSGVTVRSTGWSKHGEDLSDRYPGRFDPCRRMQWVFGGYQGKDGEDLGPQHGAVVVDLLHDPALNGDFSRDSDGNPETREALLLCLSCHDVPKTTDVFIPKAEGTAPRPDNGVPACNTCHPIHSLFWNYSSLTMMDISMTSNGVAMSGKPSPVPPMGNDALGCPQCHESPRPDSLARKVTDEARHQSQPCMTCHPAPNPVPEGK